MKDDLSTVSIDMLDWAWPAAWDYVACSTSDDREQPGPKQSPLPLLCWLT